MRLLPFVAIFATCIAVSAGFNHPRIFNLRLRTDQKDPSLLDTMSLSMSGNFGLKKIYKSIHHFIKGLLELIDLKVVKTGVDWAFNNFMPNALTPEIKEKLMPLQSRQDLLKSSYNLNEDDFEDEDVKAAVKEQKNTDNLKETTVMLIGAFMQKQQCWQRSACQIGKNFHEQKPMFSMAMA